MRKRNKKIKKQKAKNILLLTLITVATVIVIVAFIAVLVLVAVPFQSTTPGSSFFEDLARFVLASPIISFLITIISVLILMVLKKPFKRFLKRNNFAEKAAKYFGE
jgi:predicted tellurium resistance membrane protein TerC